jgi:hypothetical protein
MATTLTRYQRLAPYLDHLHQLCPGVRGQVDVLGTRALRPGMGVLQRGVSDDVPSHGQGGVVLIQHAADGPSARRGCLPQLVRVLHIHNAILLTSEPFGDSMSAAARPKR